MASQSQIPSYRDRQLADGFLAREDLYMLTGHRRASLVTAWLKRNGWIYLEPEGNARLPRVARQYFFQRLAGESTVRVPEPQTQPRLDFIRQLKGRSRPSN
jgi:Domain of unknown function (DUF4224)